MTKRKGLYILAMSTLLFLSALFQPSLGNAYAQSNGPQDGCGADRGLDIAFVMDSSGSMVWNDPSAIRIAAAKRMMADLREYDRAAVIQFSETAHLLQPLTSNRYLVNGALDKVTANGGTDMSTGMKVALDEFKSHGGNNHQIMIILTDGESISQQAAEDLADQARARNIRTYTIGLGDTTNLPTAFLKKVASQTGGQYFHAVNANQLTGIFNNIRLIVDDLRQPKVPSNWKLTQDLHMTGDLVLTENMKLDANGYDVTVDGALVMLSCSELRSVSAVVKAGSIEQSPGSAIQLNNSQLNSGKLYKQDGVLRVNGDYGGALVPEVVVPEKFEQGPSGHLVLAGHDMTVNGDFVQEGRIEMGKGSIHAKQNVKQKGFFDLQQGSLHVDGNLTIAGGPLTDEAFTTNRSLNVNGGVLQVGSQDLMDKYSSRGNVTQTSGQLFVNHGTVDIFGSYDVKDGWLTMVKGSMDTTAPDYQAGDGDFVHVHKNFTMESPRNHGARSYMHIGNKMDDPGHLTDGVLRVDGQFKQVGDAQYHPDYSDKSQEYKQSFSRTNFAAAGRHKVLLTGKTPISVEGTGFKFSILEVEGRIIDYLPWGSTLKWDRLIERDVSANADLKSLVINDVPVLNFTPSRLDYTNHVVPLSGIEGPLRELKVDARAADHLNAKVTVMGNSLASDGTAQVKILVTAKDGKTTKLYTVNVTAGGASPDRVSSLELDRDTVVFRKNGTVFTPAAETVSYRILPTTAVNQQVNWKTLDASVATVSNGIIRPVGIGTTTIVAETADGGFVKTVTVSVKNDINLLQGVHTLADFVEDIDRYNEILALYDASRPGIVVPGGYIQKVTFQTSGTLMNGRIQTAAGVSRVSAKVNGVTLPLTKLASGDYLMSRAGVQAGDFVEVIAYKASGDELERIQTSYPLDFTAQTDILPGFYSVERLLNNPTLFDDILDRFAPEQLRFELH